MAVGAPPTSGIGRVASTLTASAQPGAPTGASDAGSVIVPQLAFDNPSASSARAPLPAGVTRICTMSPSHGRPLDTRFGVPDVPAHPDAIGSSDGSAAEKYSHVSPSNGEPNWPTPPPNSTVRPPPMSNAIPAPRRGVGAASGVRCRHVTPSYSQVSPESPLVTPVAPPNSTTRSRTQSAASELQQW